MLFSPIDMSDSGHPNLFHNSCLKASRWLIGSASVSNTKCTRSPLSFTTLSGKISKSTNDLGRHLCLVSLCVCYCTGTTCTISLIFSPSKFSSSPPRTIETFCLLSSWLCHPVPQICFINNHISAHTNFSGCWII